MRAAGLAGREPKRFKRTTILDPGVDGRPDLIRRAFTPDPGVVNTRWRGDITYIRTWEGWLYLATVIDLDSRRVIGWATGDHLRTDLIADALTNAVTTRRPAAGVIFHSDRGSPVHLSPVRHSRHRSRRHPLGREDRGVLGQRHRGVVLLDHQDRAAAPPHLAHPGPSTQSDLRVDRELVQPAPTPLRARLPQPRHLGTPSPTDHHRARSLTTQQRRCPSKRSMPHCRFGS